MTESDLLSLLAIKYAAPEYAFIPHVPNGTSGFKTRTADALAMGLWASRGLYMHGFEIKCSRSDWLREKENPEKAEEIAKFCHFWWLIVADEKIVADGELPANWGLIVLRRTKTERPMLVVKKQAEKLEAKPLTLPMICSIFRRMSEISTPQAKLEEVRKHGYEEGLAVAKHANEHEIKNLREQVRCQQVAIGRFEKASGVSLKTDRYWLDENKNIGMAVRMVLDGTYLREAKRLEWLLEQVRGIGDNIQGTLKKISGESNVGNAADIGS